MKIGGVALDRVAAGLVGRLAGAPVPVDLGARELAEARRVLVLTRAVGAAGVQQRDGRVHLVRAPGEPPEHRARPRRGRRACRGSRRRAPRSCRRRAPGRRSAQAARPTARAPSPRRAAARRRDGASPGRGDSSIVHRAHLVRHADLPQQLAAPRRGGREVDGGLRRQPCRTQPDDDGRLEAALGHQRVADQADVLGTSRAAWSRGPGPCPPARAASRARRSAVKYVLPSTRSSLPSTRTRATSSRASRRAPRARKLSTKQSATAAQSSVSGDQRSPGPSNSAGGAVASAGRPGGDQRHVAGRVRRWPGRCTGADTGAWGCLSAVSPVSKRELNRAGRPAVHRADRRCAQARW